MTKIRASGVAAHVPSTHRGARNEFPKTYGFNKVAAPTLEEVLALALDVEKQDTNAI